MAAPLPEDMGAAILGCWGCGEASSIFTNRPWCSLSRILIKGLSGFIQTRYYIVSELTASPFKTLTLGTFTFRAVARMSSREQSQQKLCVCISSTSVHRRELPSCPEFLQVAPLGAPLVCVTNVMWTMQQEVLWVRRVQNNRRHKSHVFVYTSSASGLINNSSQISLSNVTAQFKGRTKRRGQHRTFYSRLH